MKILRSFVLNCVIFTFISYFTNGFNLVIVHTNDIHAHIEQMNAYTSACKKTDEAKGKCYGGISRRVTKVKEIRSQYDNVMLLDAGDQYQGSLWFNIFKGRVAALLMNKLKYDAMTFGNHEFDNGVSGLVPFLDNITFPVINCNIDTSREPRLQGRFNKSVILDVNGEKIGIVGYITDDTSFLSKPGDTLTFNPVVEAVRREVNSLKNQGIKIIIGLGHYGYGNDKKLAAAVDGLDVIVGGHTHSFLYTGKQPSNDVSEGPYPTIIKNKGRDVLVTQAFWAGKYLGFLNVTFNNDGDVSSWNGDPILLDNSTAQGNLITDAMVTYYASRHSSNDSWSDSSIAIMNSGGIRGPIGQGNISKGDVLTVMPFGSMVDAFTIKGKYLRLALEHSVENYDPIDRPGAFLQVSGLRVTYNLCKSSGSRVVSVYARCTDCLIPSFKPLEDEKVYSVIALNFVIKGGDGYTVIRDHKIKHTEFNFLDSTVFITYLQSHQPIIKGVEGRITLLHDCVNSVFG